MPYYVYDKIISPNIWDEKWEVGRYDNTTGTKTPGDIDRIRNVTPIPAIPNTKYYKTSNVSNVYFYDANGIYISYSTATPTFTTPSDCRYICFFTVSGYGTTYKNDICINVSDPSINGNYYPYNMGGKPYIIKDNNKSMNIGG